MLFPGDESDICRANLWLRAADRVLVRLGAFEARDFGQLFDRTFALPWEAWIPADAAFPVSGRSIKSQLSSVPACQKIVKKAVVERLKAAYGVEWFAETGTEVLDRGRPAGRPGHADARHQRPGAAQARLPAAGRQGPAEGDAGGGDGPAELLAARAAADRSVLRHGHDPDRGGPDRAEPGAGAGPHVRGRGVAAACRPSCGRRPGEAARDAAPPELAAADHRHRPGRAGPAAWPGYHAEKAGVAADIHFQQHAFAELTSKRQYGCVICNPPYGQRMGEQAEVAAIYRAMPDVFRRLKTWSFYILTAYPEFEAVVGQAAHRRRKLYNGRIECTYYQFYGPKPEAVAEPAAGGQGRRVRRKAASSRHCEPRRAAVDDAALRSRKRPDPRPPSPPCPRRPPLPVVPPATRPHFRRRPSAACRQRPIEQAEIFRSPAGETAPGTSAAGRRRWASPATGSTSTTSPRCRWSSIATRTACTWPSSSGPTSTRRPSTAIGST